MNAPSTRAASTGTVPPSPPPGVAPDPVLAALRGLAARLVATAPLIAARGGSLRLAAGSDAPLSGPERSELQVAVNRLARRLEIDDVEIVARREGLNAAELVIGRHLNLAELIGMAEALAAVADPVVDGVVTQALGEVPEAVRIERHDGSVLRGYAAGASGAPVVVIVSACGMPVGLVGGWMTSLAPFFRVLTWESRGLFEDRPVLDDRRRFDEQGCGLSAQGKDVAAVMAAFGVDRAHLMGLCGGAAIALAAAASPGVVSLSLWHGDYELAGRAPKTPHQQDVAAMLTMAARGRAQAASLCRLFDRPATVAKLRPDIAHHIFYPYANPELLYRYGRLNGTIMSTDCAPYLPSVVQPTLVVTSPGDTTAHPEGSVYVAHHLLAARLVTMPDGDHLAAFDAAPSLVEQAVAFIDETVAGVLR